MRIDLHADTPLLMHWAGYHFCSRHRPWLPRGAWVSHVDGPRMATAALDAQMFGLVALPVEPNPFHTINRMIDKIEQQAAQSEGQLQVVRSVAEVRQVREQGGRAVFLSMEGVHALKGRLERVDHLLARGVLSFGMCHFHANEACYPAKGLGRRDERGLTAFGRDLVRYLGEKGAIMDLTHINRQGFFESLEHNDGPVMVSHTGVDGAFEHWRNLDDAQIRAVAQRGGVIGIIFARNFVGGNTIDAVVRHIQHTINVGGEDSAALGSDFDGFVVPVKGLRDVTGLPALAEGMQRAGLSQRLVDKVMGDNVAKMFAGCLG